MTAVNYQIAIFSYNRGAYLRNCIESIERHCPGVLYTVYDDGSDDPLTVAYLKGLGAKVRHMQQVGTDRHGGFYRNMQASLDEASSSAMLLLQDDVQVVRDVTDDDIFYWFDYWDQHPDVAFLSPVFLKGSRRKDFLHYYQISSTDRVYHWCEDRQRPSKDGPVPSAYMDVCLLNVERLRQKNWRYQASEWLNGEQAAWMFPGQMPQLADPFVFYVPEEPVYRSRVKTRGTDLAVKLAGNVVKCFRSMSADETRLLKMRDIHQYPFAEDFVHTVDPKVKRPYRFNIYRTHWLARLVNKIEKLWKN